MSTDAQQAEGSGGTIISTRHSAEDAQEQIEISRERDGCDKITFKLLEDLYTRYGAIGAFYVLGIGGGKIVGWEKIEDPTLGEVWKWVGEDKESV